MKHLIISLVISSLISAVAQAQVIKVPGLFPHWKEFYKTRQLVQSNNDLLCRHGAAYMLALFESKGIKAEVIELKVLFPEPMDPEYHAVIKQGDYYYDPAKDKVSRKLASNLIPVAVYSKLEDLPKEYFQRD